MRSTLHLSLILFAPLILMALSTVAWCESAAPPANPSPVVVGLVATPAATAADWKANPPAAAVASDHQAKVTGDTAPAPDGIDWWKWALGAGGVLLAVARLAAKANPLSSLLVTGLDAAWRVLAPTHVQAAEKVQEDMAGGLMTVVHVVDQFPADSTIGELKTALQGRLAAHPAAAAVVNQWITAQENKGLQSPLGPLAFTTATVETLKPIAAAG